MDENKIDQQGNEPPVGQYVEESSFANQPLEFQELIKDTAFVGEMSYETISDGIEKQFQDYINMEDTTNYVDVFYSQLQASCEATRDPGEEHPNEIKEVLDNIFDKFIAMIQELFTRRLGIVIYDLESENISPTDLEFITRRLYEFFILGAKSNFKVVISSDINMKLQSMNADDDYFSTLDTMMGEYYSPILKEITPEKFLQLRGDIEVYELFRSGQVSGNFLLKYTPKLYQNEEFRIEVVNYTTMLHRFNQGVVSPPDISDPLNTDNNEEDGLNG